MNIVYASNNDFVEPLIVSLTSLFESNPVHNVTVYVISNNISFENKNKVLRISNKYGRNAIFINNPDIHELIGEKIELKRFSESMFSRILTDTLLPDNVKRIIYIDCDTLVMDDLTLLWEYDLHNNTIGAVRDSRNYRYNRNLGIQESRYYFYSGMLVIDMERYRSKGYESILLEGIRKYNGLLDFPDNDIICTYLQDDVCYLPLRYNITTMFYSCSFQEIEILRHPQYSYPQGEIAKSLQKPAIIHFDTFFLVSKRPWMVGCNHPLVDLWLKYRALTEYANLPLRYTKQTLKRKSIALAVAIVPKFLLFPIVGFIHSVLRPVLQGRKFRQYKIIEPGELGFGG